MEHEIIVGDSETHLWHEYVRSGERESGNWLDEDVEHHLVVSLMQSCTRANRGVVQGALALTLKDALKARGTEKVIRLRGVGLWAMLRAGFPTLVPRRVRNTLGTPTAYYIGIGKMSYANLAEIHGAQKSKKGDVYRKVSNSFTQLVEVLWVLNHNRRHPSLDELVTIARHHDAKYTHQLIKDLTQGRAIVLDA